MTQKVQARGRDWLVIDEQWALLKCTRHRCEKRRHWWLDGRRPLPTVCFSPASHFFDFPTDFMPRIMCFATSILAASPTALTMALSFTFPDAFPFDFTCFPAASL